MAEIEYALRATGPLFERRDMQELFDQEISAALVELGNLGQRLVVDGTPSGVSVGGGGLRGSIFTELRGAPALRSQVIASSVFYAPIVELGRRPGQRRPPLEPILLWVSRKLQLSGPRARSVAFLVARKIGRTGTEGKHMFQQAVQRLQPIMQQRFEALAQRITQGLGSS